VRVDNVTIPALTVRRTNTTVELRDGESLTIGGLFQHTFQNDIRQVPGLGEIPILSALFRSTRFQRNETELLIVVTPRIVTQGDIDSSKDRTIAGVEHDGADFLLTGKTLDKPLTHDLRGPIDQPPSPQLRGQIAPTAPASGK